MEKELSADESVRKLLLALQRVDDLPAMDSLFEIVDLRGIPYVLRCIADHLEGGAFDRPRNVLALGKGFAEVNEMSYSDYLMTPHWKALSAGIKWEIGKCQLCGDEGTSLQVHHNSYDNLGNEANEDLIVLCPDCHGKFHRNKKLKGA